MTEDEARAWVENLNVPRETTGLLDRFSMLLTEAAQRQNLVARSTLDQLWSRHFVDSLQLAPLAPVAGAWIDIGSGAGFPGLLMALAGRTGVTLTESRPLRAAFLRFVADELGIAHRMTVLEQRVETLVPAVPAAVVSARAVASLGKLFALGRPVVDEATTWLLPKGRSAALELAEARQAWHGEFRLVPSITDPDAAIVVATDVRPRNRR